MRAALMSLLVAVTLVLPATAGKRMDWNDRQVAWKRHSVALLEARRTRKPICLVIYTTWCPHCRDYSRLFSDRQVVTMAKEFVMVRLDRDANRKLSRRYAVDGNYIPRTFFLSPDGELVEELIASRGEHQYVYSPTDPRSLLAGMRRALDRLGEP